MAWYRLLAEVKASTLLLSWLGPHLQPVCVPGLLTMNLWGFGRCNPDGDTQSNVCSEAQPNQVLNACGHFMEIMAAIFNHVVVRNRARVRQKIREAESQLQRRVESIDKV